MSIAENISGTTANGPFLPSITLFSQIFAAYPLINIQKWLIDIININLDEKVSVKGGFYMLFQKNTKFFAHPVTLTIKGSLITYFNFLVM